MKQSRREVADNISNQYLCDESCQYSDFCPRMLDSTMSSGKECQIRMNYQTEFDTFYNLFFGESDGLKNEMRTVAYNLGKDAQTPEELLTYFNTISKMASAFYAPEKTGKADEITAVNIFFDELKSGQKSRSKSPKVISK